jgi:hypothetical protein
MQKYGTMRLRRVTTSVRGKPYTRYRLDLSKEEGIALEKLGLEWLIEDVDPKGWVQLRLKLPTSMADLHAKPEDPKTTVLLHCSKAEWEKFKKNLSEKGLTVCQSFTNYVQAVNETVDKIGDFPSVIIMNVWQGVPRSRSEKLLKREVLTK